ncbi:hypothetical protein CAUPRSCDRAFT_12893, partial [Caulochytrium protostelioides]
MVSPEPLSAHLVTDLFRNTSALSLATARSSHPPPPLAATASGAAGHASDTLPGATAAPEGSGDPLAQPAALPSSATTASATAPTAIVDAATAAAAASQPRAIPVAAAAHAHAHAARSPPASKQSPRGWSLPWGILPAPIRATSPVLRLPPAPTSTAILDTPAALSAHEKVTSYLASLGQAAGAASDDEDEDAVEAEATPDGASDPGVREANDETDADADADAT